MSYVTWKFERYAFLGSNSWSASATTLTDVFDPMVEVALGKGKDSFRAKINNFNSTYDNYFKAQDKVVISRAINTTTVTSSDVLMTGVLKTVPSESNGQQTVVRLEGYNFSEAIMSAITFTDINGLTPPAAIQQAINNAKSLAGLGITWDSTNPTTKKDGSAFPTFTKSYKNATLLKVMEECSSNQFTADGAYYWYVTPDNKLKWVPNTSGTSYTFDASTDDHTSLKTAIDTNGIRNYFILKGGRDPAGKTIQRKYIEAASAAKHGNKYYINTSKTATAESLVRLDFDEDSTTTIPSAFPFTTKWRSQQTGNFVTVNSGAAYVQAVRDEIYYRLGIEALELGEVLGYGKLKVDIEFAAGSKTWTLADQISCTIPQLFAAPKMLRVIEIQYGSDTDIFSLEEDVGSI